MARRNKLWRFAQLQTYPNYYEAARVYRPEVVGVSGDPVDMRGRWHEHFGNDNPITLELACGRGEYTCALSAHYPERNFIGVDIKGARIYQGATRLLEEQRSNAAFLRTRIESIDQHFAVGEIDEIWITFPDPFHKSVNRRLTSPRFWINYARLLRPGGTVNLKTDDDELYEYSRDSSPERRYFRLISDVDDIYACPTLPTPELAYKTYYEAKHLARGLSIKWLQWQRNDLPAPAPFQIPLRSVAGEEE